MWNSLTACPNMMIKEQENGVGKTDTCQSRVFKNTL